MTKFEMTPLFGHEPAIAAFRDSLDSGRLHHAWLLSGPVGVGKASFARAAALRTLAASSGQKVGAAGLDVEKDHPTAKLFSAGSHPDFRLVERELWDKNNKERIIPKHDRSGNEDLARNIRVIQIRWLNASLASTTSISSRRAIVIDAADDLEAGAANALLKSLEEPPPSTVFFLVSHAPERLLPTIRSRCRHLRLSALDDAAMTSALRAALPDADAGELTELVALGEGSPGRALAWRDLDIAALDKALARIAREGDPDNAERVKLSQSLGASSAQPRYEAFLARVPSFIAAHARERSGGALAEALALWERAQALAGSAKGLSLDPQTTVFELAGLVAGLAPQKADA